VVSSVRSCVTVKGQKSQKAFTKWTAKGVNIHIYGHFSGDKLIADSNPVPHKVVDAGCISRCAYGTL